MTITEQIQEALREYYKIPAEAGIIFYEEIEQDGCNCQSYSSMNLVTSWSWIPKGKKRRKEMTRWYSGSLTDFLEEVDNEPVA